MARCERFPLKSARVRTFISGAEAAIFFSCLQYILVTADDGIIASAPAPLCDGESHEVLVTISGNRTLLLVDGRSGRRDGADVPTDLLSQSSTFIGGLPGEEREHERSGETFAEMARLLKSSHFVFYFPLSDVPLVSTLVSAPYSGCMDVHINGLPLDLDQAVHKHNDIRSHSCPLLDSLQ